MPSRTPFHMLLDPLPPERVPPRATALLLQGVQRAFTAPDHGLGAARTQRGIAREFAEYDSMVAAALPNVARLAASARVHGALVIHSMLARDAADSPLSRQLAGSGLDLPGVADLQDELPPLEHAPADMVLARGAWSPFSSPALLPALRAGAIRRVILCGLMAGVHVAPAARELADRDFEVIVVNDASASETLEWHATLMQGVLGGLIRVQSTDDAIEMLEGSRT